MDLKKVTTDLFRILYIIIILYVTYQILMAIVGGTWATENILIAGIGIILAGMVCDSWFFNKSRKVFRHIRRENKEYWK